MTPAEHLVNIARRMKLRVDGERLALERDASRVKAVEKELLNAQALLTDTKERLAEAEGELLALMTLLRTTDDPELLLAYMAKL